MAGDAATEDAEDFGVKTKVIGVLTILGVILIQYGTTVLDQLIENRKSLKEIVNMMYRELMILGIVAFALFVIEATNIVSISPGDKHVFEEVHFLLFLVAIIYGVMIVAIIYFSYAIDRTWNHYEALQTVSGQWQEIRENFEALAREIGAPSGREAATANLLRQLWRFCAHPVGWMNYTRLLEHVRFHELRSHFIRANHMPRNFAFAGYLKKCKQHVMLELVEVRSGAWVLIAWILSISLFATGLDEDFFTALDVADAMCILSGLVLAACGVVYFKINNIYWCLLHSEFIHYDPNKPEAFVVSADDRRGHQESLFWFGAPGLFIDLLQFLQFAVSVNVAVGLSAIPTVAAMSPGRLAAMLVLLFFAVVGYFALLPVAVPRYTLATHVGEFVDRELLSEALKKQQRKFKTRALPPSLRQAFALAEHEAQGGSDPRARLAIFLDGGLVRAAAHGLVLIYFFVLSYQQHWLANTEEDAEARRRTTTLGQTAESPDADGGGDDPSTFGEGWTPWGDANFLDTAWRKLAGGSGDGGTGGDWSDDCGNTSSDGRCFNRAMLIVEGLFATLLLVEVLLRWVAKSPGDSCIRVDALVTVASASFTYASAHLLTSEGGNGDAAVVVHALAAIILLRVLRPSSCDTAAPSLSSFAARAKALVYHSRERSVSRGGPSRPGAPFLPRTHALALDRPLYVDTTPVGQPHLEGPHGSELTPLSRLSRPLRSFRETSSPTPPKQELVSQRSLRHRVDASEAKGEESPATERERPFKASHGSPHHTHGANANGRMSGSSRQMSSPPSNGLASVLASSFRLPRTGSRSPPMAPGSTPPKAAVPSPSLDLSEVRKSLRDRNVRKEHGKHLLAMQLWQDILAKYPAIVAAEGKFSVPVLRLMLGLKAYDETKESRPALSRATSRSGTLSNASSYSSATSVNSSGYAEESDEASDEDPEAAELLGRDARKRYDQSRAEGLFRANTTYDGSDNDSEAASPKLRRRRRRRSPKDENEDREAPILPQPPGVIARMGSWVGFDTSATNTPEPPGAHAQSSRDATARSQSFRDVSALGLEPARHRRVSSVETRMFEQLVEQTGVSMTPQEAEEAWAEDRWLSTVLRRGDAFSRAPPELPRWRDAHILLTRKELAFANRDQTVDIEGGVLYPNHDLRKRISLNTITALEMADHKTILKVRTPYMTVQVRGGDQGDTLAWFEQIRNAKAEAARL